MNYDIIGDIHGHADELEVLLQKLGYGLEDGVYKHKKNRQVIFLGDFIDRGPKIRETLHIAKNMCDFGSARAIMGNHEFNAIAFHTKNQEDGGYFRKHDYKEIHQHYSTLEQFKLFPEELKMFINWFRELPIFLEIEDKFRVVHACWDQNLVKYIKAKYDHDKDIFSDDFLRAATGDSASKENQAIEELLKGKEQKLPQGLSFKDKDGNLRENCRVKWWQPSQNRQTFDQLLMFCPDELKGKNLSESDSFYSYNEEIPVFFGHYWLKGNPKIEHENAICLDYSVAKEGLLVAYKSEFLDKRNMERADGYVW
jgi:hypothetical protein